MLRLLTMNLTHYVGSGLNKQPIIITHMMEIANVSSAAPMPHSVADCLRSTYTFINDPIQSEALSQKTAIKRQAELRALLQLKQKTKLFNIFLEPELLENLVVLCDYPVFAESLKIGIVDSVLTKRSHAIVSSLTQLVKKKENLYGVLVQVATEVAKEMRLWYHHFLGCAPHLRAPSLTTSYMFNGPENVVDISSLPQNFWIKHPPTKNVETILSNIATVSNLPSVVDGKWSWGTIVRIS